MLAALPAVFAFAGCSKDEDPVITPAPDQGAVLFVNAAANTFVGIKAFVDAEEKTQLTYGQNGGGATPLYQTVNAGSRTIKIDNAAAGTAFFSQSATVEKDKRHSFFIYSPNATATPAGLFTTDNLTAPMAGKAKIRLVHVALGFPVTTGAISLSQTQPVGFLPLTAAVAFPGSSDFVEINAGPANLLVTTGTSPAGLTVATVGDGTGTGTGNKNFEAGKIYTIVVRGAVGNQDPSRDAKAFIIQNN
ncbi:hypothetical protein GCM10022408_30090 [Hymenobacter fastidiosus]|uniref:DUF4397 domain-containing protein n=1 Tax=Hymenobacter fastidiosus TaxID=486264 RepID=A0ABP7SPY2_9BACT